MPLLHVDLTVIVYELKFVLLDSFISKYEGKLSDVPVMSSTSIDESHCIRHKIETPSIACK